MNLPASDGHHLPPAVNDAEIEQKKPRKSAFTITDDGCRSDVRLGALLLIGGIFLWMWLGPRISTWVSLSGLALLAWGIPHQALQARQGRPGYPWKLAIGCTIIGLGMLPDALYRELPGGPLRVLPTAPALLLAGIWMLLWLPLARPVRSDRPQGMAS